MKKLQSLSLSLVVIATTLFSFSNPSYGCGTNPKLIQTNSTTTASIYYEIDYYKIVLSVAGKLHVYATNVDLGNLAYTAGKLKNNSCVTIASDSGVFDFTDTNFTITKNLNPGTYYIEVSRSSSANQFISERSYYLYADFTPSSPENSAFLAPVYHLLFSGP